jgi:uncharacterized damage-inducible protein DinB
MNSEIQSYINNLSEALDGEPWYGKSVNSVFTSIDEKKVYSKPPQNSHSLIELLYHMNSWAEFTLAQLTQNVTDISEFDKKDWIAINPEEHRWGNAVNQFRSVHEKIITELRHKEDDFLNAPVSFRNYNVRYLLNGLLQHDIYHIGQMAYVNKLLII